MTALKTLEALTGALDERLSSISENETYLAGKQPLAFLSTQARESTKLGRMASNIPRLAVTSLAERLRVTDLLLAGRHDDALWADFRRNDLDQLLGVAFREALGLGSAYGIVWDRTGSARPKVSIESAKHVALSVDPGTGETIAAVKRWNVADGSRAMLYLPDAVIPYAADGENATVGWREGEAIRNPLGVVPVVEFRNGDRLLGPGVSEIEDLKPLVDALNKVLADMMVGSEFYARPRRWATGVELGTDEDGEAVNPFPEGDRMMISEATEARFGSLPAADLHAYEAAVKILLGQIMAVSALPAHYIGVFNSNPTSADGNRSAEASLAARAEARQAQFGRSVEAIGRLMHAIRTESDPDAADVSVVWADPATRSVAQEADAVVKLHTAGLLPADYALARLGYSGDDIREIQKARRLEAASRLDVGAIR